MGMARRANSLQVERARAHRADLGHRPEDSELEAVGVPGVSVGNMNDLQRRWPRPGERVGADAMQGRVAS
jgi:hypothetical protein